MAVSQSGDIVIRPANATLTLGNLSHVYDGTPKFATVTTTPDPLPIAVIYNGSPDPPIAAGTYRVIAKAIDPKYTGSVEGTLTIGAATPRLQISGDGQYVYSGVARFVTAQCTAVTGEALQTLVQGPVNGAVTVGVHVFDVTCPQSQNYVELRRQATIEITKATLS